MGKSIFILSGEESGDQHGASLMAALKRVMPGISIKGMGGVKMREAGLEGLDSRDISVVGITEVIEKFPTILKAFGLLKKRLKAERPDAVVLIDFPDFNLRFGKEAKKLGIPVIYYISPQVWAWRKGRVSDIKGLVDKMLVVFPFEEKIYRKAGVDVEYVGHPLADTAICALSKEEARTTLGIPPKKTVIALLPGSRTAEVKRLLPPMLQAASIIKDGIAAPQNRGSQEAGDEPIFLLLAAGSISDGLVGSILKGPSHEVRVVRDAVYTALRASDAAVVASGTATLETALIGTPMVIVYKTSSLTYAVAKALVGVDYIGLPNIIAGEKIVAELIQGAASAGNIARETLDILNGPGRKDAIIQGYGIIRKRLRPGAPQKAAEAIKKVITRTSWLRGHTGPP
ncbi:MAG: lipid-A-disaccharide synthase [Deltaproteobacteria bacterium]|nr:lipid-A-disaccharide synthase [Deltaproteobacteria bacterium]